jgi:hypothetical protein
MGKRSSNPSSHSQDMVESAARIHRSISITGLAPDDAQVILHDIETLASRLTTVIDDIDNISGAWHGQRHIRRDSLQHLQEHLRQLKTAMDTARTTAHNAAFALEPELDLSPLPEANGATPADAASASTPTANGRKARTTTPN